MEVYNTAEKEFPTTACMKEHNNFHSQQLGYTIVVQSKQKWVIWQLSLSWADSN